MTEENESVADSLTVGDYQEPSAGMSIAGHAREMYAAENFGELAAASGDMLADGAAFMGGAATDVVLYTFDPVGWVTSMGLDMVLDVIHPLRDWLHQVTGDGPAIGHAADNYVTLAQGFVELADDFEKTGDTALKDWLDEAGDSARLALADFSTGIRGIGSCAGSVSEVLRMWSMVMVVIEDVIKAIIAEFAAWAITVWAPTLSTALMSFGATVSAAMTATVNKAVVTFKKVTQHLGVFGKLLDKFMDFLKWFSDGLSTVSRRLRMGKYVKEGERALPVIGKAPIGLVAKETLYTRSRRIVTTTEGLAAGVGPLVAGMGAKSGIATGAGVAGEVTKEVTGEGPVYDDSEIGGDQSVADTRENLDI